MSTISYRNIVDDIIKGNGIYPGDHIRVIKIVEYTNSWGKQCWGVIYAGGSVDAYAESDFVHNPKTIWEYKG